MLQCSRCHRANPNEARFCYFDGTELRRLPGPDDTKRELRLPHPFIFPSGRSCRTFNDLVEACQAEWEVARDLLTQGVFQQFLATAGRMDLAEAAQPAKSPRDPDIALDKFLAGLPANVERAPRLDLNLRRLSFGTMHVGDTRQILLAVVNQGKGLLHGTLTVAEGTNWLRLGEGRGNGQCLIKALRQQEITVRVDTHGLAAPHQYSAKLTVITNGGIVEVPVGLDLEVQPFGSAPFQGVSSPREMAERMRLHPKPAVPFLESGEIARWFEVNGWTYPVSEPAAPGVAAVQQFFEGMGLSKPPVIQLSTSEVAESCLAGEIVQGQLTLRTTARKWVYARAESDAPWLRLPEQRVSGPQQAMIPFEAHSEHLQPGRVHEGTLKITANGGQVLRVSVRLEVRPAKKGPYATVSAMGEPTVSGKRLPHPTLIGAAAGLLFRLLLALPVELWLRWPLGSAESMNAFVAHFVLLTWWVGAVVGAGLLWRRGTHRTDIIYGLIAGTVAGLVSSATLACLLPELDWLPRWLWVKMPGLARLGMPLWIALAAVSWTIWGALAGFLLGCSGRLGRPILDQLARRLSSLCRFCRLKRAAAYFGGS